MSDNPSIGDIVMFAGNFAPRGWAFCDGQELQVSSNPALWSILRFTYGGDGIDTFRLPDLRGRVAVHAGTAPGLQAIAIGQSDGSNTNDLDANNLPAHAHEFNLPCSSAPGSSVSPVNSYPAKSSEDNYSSTSNASMGSLSIGDNSAAQDPVNNMQPFLGIRFIIALIGTYPTP